MDFFCIDNNVGIVGGGCASIVSGQNQSIAIKTIDRDGNDVLGARCTLENDDGKWFATTPDTLSIDRSAENLNIVCKKEGVADGVLSVESTTKSMAWGNIIFGGIIGGAVDAETGAAFDYPSLLVVEMGKTVRLGDKKSADE